MQTTVICITGTEQQHVADDYHLRLDEALNLWTEASGDHFCKYLNISLCSVTEGDQFDVFVYNPLGQEIDTTLVRFPVSGQDWIVFDEDQIQMASQILKVAEAVKRIPAREGWEILDHEVVFQTGHIPPLSRKQFTFVKDDGKF